MLTQGLTAYYDIALDKCYVIELNTTIVMAPRNLWEMLVNVKVTDCIKFYVTHEQKVSVCESHV